MSIFLELTKRQTRRVFQNPSGLSFFPLSPSTCLLTSASYPLVPVWRNLRCIQCNVVHIIHHMHQASYTKRTSKLQIFPSSGLPIR